MSIDTWTPERVEQLQSFVGAGLSCSQIAAQIGVTRNAVIGKIHRLGLSPVRPPGAATRSCPPRARDPRAASQRRRLRLLWSDGAVTAEAAGPAVVESAEPCSLLDLAQVDRNLIREIDDALKRIEDGTYGVCLRTGQRISAERLAELPWAKYSIEAQREMERRPYHRGGE